MIKVMVSGFKGRMGTTSTHMVLREDRFELVAVVDAMATEKSLNELVEYQGVEVPVFTSIDEAIDQVDVDVAIDFTQPQTAYTNLKTYIERDVHPVVGTTGFSDEQLEELTKISADKKFGGLIAPNFAIGSVLMQVFSGYAAKYFKDVEIIEMHHDQKLDAPSGTAKKTAELIYENRGNHQTGHPDEKETMPGARGADYHGIKIHSVRLPGLNSHQIVQFGGNGEGLTIRQDSYDRESYMQGVAMGVNQVQDLETLVYGLENLL